MHLRLVSCHLTLVFLIGTSPLVSKEEEREGAGREGREKGREEKISWLGLVAQGCDPKYTRGRYKRFRVC